MKLICFLHVCYILEYCWMFLPVLCDPFVSLASCGEPTSSKLLRSVLVICTQAVAHKASMVKQTLHYFKLFGLSDIEKIWKNPKRIKTWKKSKMIFQPWGQWTPGAQWYLAGIHHSLCSWTSRRSKYAFSCTGEAFAPKRTGTYEVCTNWMHWCTLLVDL